MGGHNSDQYQFTINQKFTRRYGDHQRTLCRPLQAPPAPVPPPLHCALAPRLLYHRIVSVTGNALTHPRSPNPSLRSSTGLCRYPRLRYSHHSTALSLFHSQMTTSTTLFPTILRRLYTVCKKGTTPSPGNSLDFGGAERGRKRLKGHYDKQNIELMVISSEFIRFRTSNKGWTVMEA